MMFDKFTERAKKVMSFAREEARRFNHEYIGTEHVLLGLLREESGIAGEVLRSLGVRFDLAQREVGRIVKQGALAVGGALPFTPRAKDALLFAKDEQEKLLDNYIGTEHLLLGLIREQEGIAAHVFMNLNVKGEDVRREVMRFLGVTG